MTTPSTWDLIDAEVREYSVNGDQRAKDLFTKAIAAAEARGYARAKEQAAAIASNMAHNCGAAATGMATEANQRAWLKAQEMSADVEQSIRALKDEGGEKP